MKLRDFACMVSSFLLSFLDNSKAKTGDAMSKAVAKKIDTLLFNILFIICDFSVIGDYCQAYK